MQVCVGGVSGIWHAGCVGGSVWARQHGWISRWVYCMNKYVLLYIE